MNTPVPHFARIHVVAFGVAVIVLASGCASDRGADQAGIPEGRMAVAELSPTRGSNVRGTVTFVEETQGVRVTANLTGLTPGDHGFHIHEVGDCSSQDGSSAGAHFNPDGASHGAPHSTQRHTGDMGNVTADAAGVVRHQYVDNRMTFEGASSILGRSVIVHADPDDYTSQPSGNAGARLACGVIRER
jgi:Cu-Zn family superoxide dismutase